MQLGDAFTFRSGSDGHHLWVVLSDPTQNSTQVLIVNLTTWRGNKLDDPACVIEAGEHPWVVNNSYIAYRHARIYKLDQLELLERSRSLELHDPFTQLLQSRVTLGASISENLDQRFLELLRNQGLISDT
jgi:hypothetical protein